jgi:hypothetical protein
VQLNCAACFKYIWADSFFSVVAQSLIVRKNSVSGMSWRLLGYVWSYFEIAIVEYSCLDLRSCGVWGFGRRQLDRHRCTDSSCVHVETHLEAMVVNMTYAQSANCRGWLLWMSWHITAARRQVCASKVSVLFSEFRSFRGLTVNRVSYSARLEVPMFCY